jgi:hypothetical protein
VLWLSRGRARADWHLQHGRLLAWTQFRQLDDLTVRQFERVVVDARLVQINLPKPGQFVLESFETKAKGGFALKIFFKG